MPPTKSKYQSLPNLLTTPDPEKDLYEKPLCKALEHALSLHHTYELRQPHEFAGDARHRQVQEGLQWFLFFFTAKSRSSSLNRSPPSDNTDLHLPTIDAQRKPTWETVLKFLLTHGLDLLGMDRDIILAHSSERTRVEYFRYWMAFGFMSFPISHTVPLVSMVANHRLSDATSCSDYRIMWRCTVRPGKKTCSPTCGLVSTHRTFIVYSVYYRKKQLFTRLR